MVNSFDVREVFTVYSVVTLSDKPPGNPAGTRHQRGWALTGLAEKLLYVLDTGSADVLARYSSYFIFASL